MRISDWSSDVCSSDLSGKRAPHAPPRSNTLQTSSAGRPARPPENGNDGLQDRACLLEGKTRIAVEQLAVVAVTKVDQEVGLQATVGKKLRIDLGQVHTTHRTAIEPQGARGDHEVAASLRAVARALGRPACRERE